MDAKRSAVCVCIVHTTSAQVPLVASRLAESMVDHSPAVVGGAYNNLRLMRTSTGKLVALFSGIDGSCNYDVLHKILVTRSLFVTFDDVLGLPGVPYNECVPLKIDQAILVTAMDLESLTDTRWGLDLPSRARVTGGIWESRPDNTLWAYPFNLGQKMGVADAAYLWELESVIRM